MTATQVTAQVAGDMLGLSRTTIYDLCATGKLEKKYIGTGTRNFRITVASIERYTDSLSSDPVPVEVDA